MLDERFVLLGALLNLLGSASYVISTIKGKTKPNRVTWFLLALAPLIAFASEIGQQVGLQSIMTFMVGFSPLMVFLASFVNRKSYWRITRLDLVCGTFSVAALVLWRVTGEGNIAIMLSIVADFSAVVPTLIKSFRYPETENHKLSRNAAVSAAITLLTIKDWTLGNYAFPGYIFLVCAILYLLVRFKLGAMFVRRTVS